MKQWCGSWYDRENKGEFYNRYTRHKLWHKPFVLTDPELNTTKTNKGL